MRVLIIVLTVIEGYLLGSLSFGIITTRILAKKDIRTLGSGNAGMTNVLRSVGSLAGALTGFGDFAKGAISIVLGRWLF
ncbi:MAG: glycerol-3-phosphate acyltransferase, partial [Oscillospiraceae bacterium]